ncbi:MAG: maleylacetate reductase [Chloroflexi bacterium]|nr:MAG: maleylacetate reductase [Chloroflexota bacterium]
MDQSSTFTYTFYAEEVVFGVGTLARLGEVTDRHGLRRVLVCTTPHSRGRGHLDRIEATLGDRLVAIYEGVRPHVPQSQVSEAVSLASQHTVDGVIGLGGGSSIGMAKATGLALEELRTGRPARAGYPTDQPLVPVIAIPSTYSGSEMTPIYGVTYQTEEGEPPRKVTVTDAKVTPKVSLYDPVLTLDLPPALTAGTGINAIAHCIEALYSISRNPVSSSLARSGLQVMAEALPRCYRAGDDLAARTDMLMGSFLAGTALSNVAMGLHHGLCHVLGGATGVAHGDVNSVLLPHVIRFNLEATAPALAEAALAMGAVSAAAAREDPQEGGLAAAGRVIGWVREMHLPERLRDLGVSEADLPQLANLAMANRTIQNNPRPIRDSAEIEALLRAAW